MCDPFDVGALEQLGGCLIDFLTSVYRAHRSRQPETAPLPPIPLRGCGPGGVPDLWRRILGESVNLASPTMCGHMDTAPHPVAALTSGLVAALNNNLLFRELSPFASRVEEQLVGWFGDQMGLAGEFAGTFVSGGSIANLTCLFAAVGGYTPSVPRTQFRLLAPESTHVSIRKAACVLGLPDNMIHIVPCDSAGRTDVSALATALASGGRHTIVVSVVGSTIHGSIDDIATIADLCAKNGAWLHVDAVYGGALLLSKEHRHRLHGLERADSVALGPQKWMYVPRLCSICFVRGPERFERLLGTRLPYSANGQAHRGQWGLQGSRPADAVVLWTLLQTVGTQILGEMVDRSIELTRYFHEQLEMTDTFSPTHVPDLNLQAFRCGAADDEGSRLAAVQSRLTERGRSWLSLSRWRGEFLLRAVLLSPNLSKVSIDTVVADLTAAARDVNR